MQPRLSLPLRRLLVLSPPPRVAGLASLLAAAPPPPHPPPPPPVSPPPRPASPVCHAWSLVPPPPPRPPYFVTERQAGLPLTHERSPLLGVAAARLYRSKESTCGASQAT